MENHSIVVYIVLMIVVTNLIRILPVLLIRGRIRNRFVRSFLYYVPYVTLAVMTFPSIVQTTDSMVPGLLALVSGVIAAWRGLGLFPVAIICCVVTYLAQFIS